jgi:hypothetical protein
VREGGREEASEPEGVHLVKARGSIFAARFGTAALLAGSCVAAAAATVALVGTEIWCGSWEIGFPETTGAVSVVTGSLAFQDGQFVSSRSTFRGTSLSSTACS